MVAVIALRMDRLHYCGYLHLYDWTHRRNLPYTFPRRQQGVFRHLGFSVASFQPGGYGLYLVWRSIVDWRYGRLIRPIRYAMLMLAQVNVLP